MKQSKLFKVVSLIGISVLTMGLFVGCGSSKDSKVLVMGTNAEFEPFEYREGTDIVGFDVDIAKAIADKMGKELKIEDMAFDSLLLALGSDKIDFVAAGLTVDDERKKQADFTQTYFKSKQVIIVKADNTEISTVDNLVGKTVGVQLGTTGDLAISAVEGVEVIRLDKGTQAVADLQNGKVDAVVIDEEPAKKMIAGKDDLKIIEAPFVEEEYAIAIKKGDQALVDEMNKALDDLKASGEYDTIYEKYFGKAE
ncbi:basic amino acid ABC transporter substrate-binding protein [Cellulosilyticum sp. ST5]|uniref:basic amino acid ABC transporter substrate-binding protein n=1 Tax=unclassified Cellulosilyticum TaxID=2643091 RepID=UPI000F8D4C59|nr:basic amino acid ABC transporter substrate-binding protein [Cellulosilyticum sp. WCF-2]QEH70718.1 basic amino acid ABC transporter substrate-binding protein [Cellulosilyticum sp. WCF-2]